MSHTPNDEILDIARELFAEAYEGACDDWTWFVNHGPDGGIFGTIEPLAAEQASAVPDGCQRSIAAHVEHLRWWLANVNGVARGEAWDPDWSTSWSVQSVDADQWNELRDALRREYEGVIAALRSIPSISDRQMLMGICSMAPHAAHHLGTIRQMAKQIGVSSEQ